MMMMIMMMMIMMMMPFPEGESASRDLEFVWESVLSSWFTSSTAARSICRYVWRSSVCWASWRAARSFWWADGLGMMVQGIRELNSHLYMVLCVYFCYLQWYQWDVQAVWDVITIFVHCRWHAHTAVWDVITIFVHHAEPPVVHANGMLACKPGHSSGVQTHVCSTGFLFQ